jgi:hypothetical protein
MKCLFAVFVAFASLADASMFSTAYTFGRTDTCCLTSPPSCSQCEDTAASSPQCLWCEPEARVYQLSHLSLSNRAKYGIEALNPMSSRVQSDVAPKVLNAIFSTYDSLAHQFILLDKDMQLFRIDAFTGQAVQLVNEQNTVTLDVNYGGGSMGRIDSLTFDPSCEPEEQSQEISQSGTTVNRQVKGCLLSMLADPEEGLIKFVKFSHVSGQRVGQSQFNGATFNGRFTWDPVSRGPVDPVFRVLTGVVALGGLSSDSGNNDGQQLMFVVLSVWGEPNFLYLVAMDTSTGAEYFRKKIPFWIYSHLAFDQQQDKLLGIAYQPGRFGANVFFKIGGLHDALKVDLRDTEDINFFELFPVGSFLQASAALDPVSGSPDVNNNYPGEYWTIINTVDVAQQKFICVDPVSNSLFKRARTRAQSCVKCLFPTRKRN